MSKRLQISPSAYSKLATITLILLSAIVFTGAAVRITGSGLGCPDWPKCHGQAVAPLEYHAVIEYANRIFSGLVGVSVIAVCVLAFFRRPFRWKLAAIGAVLPLGVIGQAILGALVVKYHLAPGLVIGHFILSMIILDAAFALAWCARYEPGERPVATDKVGTWAVRALIPFGQLTILAGTIATGSGPHAGSHEGQLVHRFNFKGDDTLSWVVQRHGAIAALFGLAAFGIWLMARMRPGSERVRTPLTLLVGLIALQGVIGIVQYNTQLPAGLVWFHVSLAVPTWLTLLWAVARAGFLAPERAWLDTRTEIRASAPEPSV